LCEEGVTKDGWIREADGIQDGATLEAESAAVVRSGRRGYGLLYWLARTEFAAEVCSVDGGGDEWPLCQTRGIWTTGRERKRPSTKETRSSAGIKRRDNR
jgi:hypothetical protein